ncbi:BlaI/MecI/CopY family transcriptional regulator [Clostridioides difficile]|uniref:BlaI/MecI/CopY family transcriptional regulator n=1 Tax=Clostridioides difficile TaxID=1496 RepID=UPI001C17B617|nr:BlaI/MecI/CopY family transcriptional regulator [Clostridioides difficile]EKJ1396001.1 BlaI/MecI/CopY family transcriptional regulator [Clostridioides difficile]MCU5873435.1 BlaI/MecI/CopY family transcriptional regulator [Clostridioides difficile]MCU5897203.1 BlaI/MecI/CopY family transcriptional regulator [Clostridioides difficile]MDL0162725.1 BlaI/MecI/CopY family transcriptional regulator [Clostridioides difficile]HBF0844872.1 BlaI/MecI/CopY family transcriptional regulator [Clostridioi
MKISKLPEAELKVMRYIWESDKILTSREITEAMEQKYEWKDTTTFTVLKRLQRREFLETEKIDKRTHYNVLVKEKQYQRFETIEFIKNIHKNSIKSLISALHKDDENVDEKKLDELEEYFNNLEENEK